MSIKHSTLELAKHDTTAGAPEYAGAVKAFELDSRHYAPEVKVARTPPELEEKILDPNSHILNLTSDKEVVPIRNDKSKKISLLALVCVLLVIGVSVGVGVGVGSRRNHDRQKSASSSLSSNSTSPVEPPEANNSSSTNSSNTSVPSRTILNDTSLAAGLSFDGNRHVFFQDSKGLVRHAMRTGSTGQWTASPLDNVTSEARDHTPLATIVQQSSEGAIQQTVICVYFVLKNHSITQSCSAGGSWEAGSLENIENRTVAAGSRHLSITSAQSTINPNLDNPDHSARNITMNQALLLYQNPDGNVSALLNYVANCDAPDCADVAGEWIDISSQKASAAPTSQTLENDGSSVQGISSTLYGSAPGFTFGIPFVSGRDYTSNRTDLTVQSLFYSPPSGDTPDTDGILSTVFESFSNNSHGVFTEALPSNSKPQPGPHDSDAIHNSDIVILGANQNGMWINGTTPTSITIATQAAALGSSDFDAPTTLNPMPDLDFPFARLATGILQATAATFLYHQINGTMLAEEQWDPFGNHWLPTAYISIPDS